MPTAVILFMLTAVIFMYAESCYFTLTAVQEQRSCLSLFMQKAVLELKLPVSVQGVPREFILPLSAFSGFWTLLDFLNLFLVSSVFGFSDLSGTVFWGLLHEWTCWDDLFLLFLRACLSAVGRLCTKVPYDPMMELQLRIITCNEGFKSYGFHLELEVLDSILNWKFLDSSLNWKFSRTSGTVSWT